MMLEWKEQVHEVNDMMDLGDQGIVYALKDCHLMKFLMCPYMWVQPLLLETLVNMWDVDCQHFVVNDQILNLEFNDIYFQMRISR